MTASMNLAAVSYQTAYVLLRIGETLNIFISLTKKWAAMVFAANCMNAV
jgi:hypothetical protein